MNNVYIRGNKTLANITLARIGFILPLIIYGIYKNGLYLYQKKFISISGVFKPILFIFIGALAGILVNIIYEKIIKKNKDNIISCIFTSFHMEYGILIACMMPINGNLIAFSLVTFILLFISKFFNNRVNIVCLICIVLYFINNYLNVADYKNIYEASKVFDLRAFDYFFGKGIGGICTTNIFLIIVALFGLYYTNNNKTTISLSGMFVIILLFTIYSIISGVDYKTLIFGNNILFLLSFVATDSVTSCYTIKGKKWFGALISILIFAFYFINPVIGPYLAILIVSLFNNLIDRKLG